MHYIDDYTGENCAMIAARNGNIDMIRYLYEDCKANFHILNKRKENAV